MSYRFIFGFESILFCLFVAMKQNKNSGSLYIEHMCWLFDWCMSLDEKNDNNHKYDYLDEISEEFELIRNNTTARKNRIIWEQLYIHNENSKDDGYKSLTYTRR
jgi:hypothetical protein